MSWEKEEAKSRHVDFQCVKSKSITNLNDPNGTTSTPGQTAVVPFNVAAPVDDAVASIGGLNLLVNEPYPDVQPPLDEMDGV